MGELFWEDFLGGFFWEDFLGGFLWEEFFVYFVKVSNFDLNLKGIDAFVKILSQ